MKPKVVLSLRALRDLQNIGDYLAREGGRRVAGAWVDKLEARALGLADNAERGQKLTSLGPTYRRLVVRPYLIIYEINERSIDIQRIVHGAQDFSALFPPQKAE
jgi:toxin ParE1/3/4